jgi:hypothetical protein
MSASLEVKQMDMRSPGRVVFAAVVLGVAGIMRIFDAVWAFRFHGALSAGLEGAIFGHRPTARSAWWWPRCSSSRVPAAQRDHR